MNERYFEKRYCDDCITVHWVEVWPGTNRQKCHGGNLPKDSATHYTKWRAGRIVLCEKTPAKTPALIPAPDWILAERPAALIDDVDF